MGCPKIWTTQGLNRSKFFRERERGRKDWPNVSRLKTWINPQSDQLRIKPDKKFINLFFWKNIGQNNVILILFLKKKKIGVDSLYLWPEPCPGLDFKTMIMAFYILTYLSWTNLELRIFYDDILKIKIKILSLEICLICTFYSGTTKIVPRIYLFLSLYLFLFNQIYFYPYYPRDSN